MNITSFNFVDYIILGIFLLSVLVGLIRGLFKEVLALINWIVAFVVAAMFALPVANRFASRGAEAATTSNLDDQSVSLLAIGISFVIIFICVYVIGRIIIHFITSAFQGNGIGFANRFLGAIFGLARGIVMVLLLMFIVDLSPLSDKPDWHESRLVTSLEPVLNWLDNAVTPSIQDLKTKMEQKIKDMNHNHET